MTISGPPYPRYPTGASPGGNAIGSFVIGSSPIGTIPSFDLWTTVISQYSNSPILTGILQSFFDALDQTVNIDAYFDNIWNINTAQGYGLDVWGRIVGVTRIVPVPGTITYLGFEEAGTSGVFGVGIFFSGSPLTNNFILSDDGFRTLILAKALANISDGSIKAINKLLLTLFKNRGNAYVTDGGEGASSVRVLLHLDGTNASTTIVDDNFFGASHVWTAAGNAQISTASSKFGGASGLFDGTGDFLTTPDSADLEVGSSNFTVDAWFNCSAVGGTTRAIAGKAVDTANSGWMIRRESSNVIAVYMLDFSGGPFLLGTTQFTNLLNPGWHHIAVTRSGSSWKLFIDGVVEASATQSFSVTDNVAVCSVGSWGTTGLNDTWLGNIDEFRLSIGIALWTSNFIPPTSAAQNNSMTMTYTFAFSLSAVELSIVQNSGVLPRPAGVSVTVVTP